MFGSFHQRYANTALGGLTACGRLAGWIKENWLAVPLAIFH
jgi:hypothetical protein